MSNMSLLDTFIGQGKILESPKSRGGTLAESQFRRNNTEWCKANQRFRKVWLQTD